GEPPFQFVHAAHAVAADGDDDVAAAQPRLPRRLAVGPHDLHALVLAQAQATPLVGVEVARLQAEAPDRGGLRRRRRPRATAAAGAGHAALLAADGHLDVTQPALTEHFQSGAASRRHHAHQRRQVTGIVDPGAVEAADHVHPAQAGFLGRASGLDPGDQRPARVGQADRVGLLTGDALDGHAQHAAAHRPGLLDLLGGIHRQVDRDRETHAHVTAGVGEDLGVDAHDFAVGVEQRAAGVATVDRHVGLDERHVLLVGVRVGAADGADDARGDRVV